MIKVITKLFRKTFQSDTKEHNDSHIASQGTDFCIGAHITTQLNTLLHRGHIVHRDPHGYTGTHITTQRNTLLHREHIATQGNTLLHRDTHCYTEDHIAIQGVGVGVVTLLLQGTYTHSYTNMHTHTCCSSRSWRKFIFTPIFFIMVHASISLMMKLRLLAVTPPSRVFIGSLRTWVSLYNA